MMRFSWIYKDAKKFVIEPELDEVNDIKYLGAYINSSDRDISTRIALAWAACRKLENVWNSELSKEEKFKFFVACVESVLLYGSETCVMTKKLEKKIVGVYTRLLREVFNATWHDKIRNEKLYRGNKLVSEKIRGRRIKFAGHCPRHIETTANVGIFWTPDQGRRSIERRKMKYFDEIKRNTNVNNKEGLETTMMDRKSWKLFQ